MKYFHPPKLFYLWHANTYLITWHSCIPFQLLHLQRFSLTPRILFQVLIFFYNFMVNKCIISSKEWRLMFPIDFQFQMWKAAFTEFVTALIVFTLTTIISCLDSHAVEPKLLVPLAVFIISFLFLLVTIPLSGGQMSPAFTFIAALRDLVTLSRAAIYVLAQ